MIDDQFADLSPDMCTHRYRAHGTTSFAFYDQIWTSSDLAVAAAHVMRRAEAKGCPDGAEVAGALARGVNMSAGHLSSSGWPTASRRTRT